MDHYEYPELVVAPRSSDRVQSEADKEMDRKGGVWLPFQTSALATFMAGFASFRPNSPAPAYSGIAVGGVWIIASSILSMSYRPYQSAWQEVAPMPKGSMRDQLARERAAEEAIRSAARLGSKLKWASTISNLGASVFMLGSSSGEDWPSSMKKNMSLTFSAVSAGLSLLPFIFRPYWQDVHEQQMDYKKRIYGPVATGTLFFDSGTRSYIPGVALSFAF
jgi:hypothetical protein